MKAMAKRAIAEVRMAVDGEKTGNAPEQKVVLAKACWLKEQGHMRSRPPTPSAVHSFWASSMARTLAAVPSNMYWR
jgi:hypothetical protein